MKIKLTTKTLLLLLTALISLTTLLTILFPYEISALIINEGSIKSNHIKEVKLTGLSIPFVKNDGETSKEVKYYARFFSGAVFVTEDFKIHYKIMEDKNTKLFFSEEFLNSIKRNLKEEDFTDTSVNYFHKSNPNSHNSKKAFETVNFGEIYDGIQLKLSKKGNSIEKIFEIKPYKDPNQIQISLNGVNNFKIDKKGNLLIKGIKGEIIFTKPIAYQEKGGQKIYVPAKYKILKNTPNEKIYAFSLGKYDPSERLIIDPLLQSTYIGGSREDKALSISINNTSGNIYVTGHTTSVDFPAISGGADMQLTGSGDEVFVARFNGDLTQLQQATFLGGSGNDKGTGIAINQKTGDVYVCGTTQSNDFPKVWGGADPVFSGNNEGFVARLSGDLKILHQSTFIGGSLDDYANAIDINGDTGDVYVVGSTLSTDFPGTRRGAQNTHLGMSDGFIVRLDANLTNLLGASYIGGDKNDEANSLVAKSSNGQVYVAGWTASSNFPQITGGADATFTGNTEAFVSLFDRDLSILYQSTFLGGNNEDRAYSIALNNITGDVYVGGYTLSNDFPNVKGASDETFEVIEGFVARLDAPLKTIKNATYLGGSNFDYVRSVKVNEASGDVYAGGETFSDNFPKTSGGADFTFGGNSEGFVSRLSGDFKTLYQSSYVGGKGNDSVNSIVINPTNGFVYVAGETNSDDIPFITGGGDSIFSGTNEGFLSNFSSDLMLISPVYTLTITKTLKGTGTGDINATGCPITWSGTTGTCKANTTRTITLTGNPKNNSQWLGWSKGTGSASLCTGTANCVFNLTADSSITGTFDSPPPQYSLTVTKAGTGNGDINAMGCQLSWKDKTGKCTVTSGTSITLSGTAQSGSSWEGWSGGTGSAKNCTGKDKCTFSISTNSTITGTFNISNKPQYRLIVKKIGSGEGDITSQGCLLKWNDKTGNCTAETGTKITLSGVAKGLSTWEGWFEQTGSTTSCKGTGDCVFNLDSNSSISGLFSLFSQCKYSISPQNPILSFLSSTETITITASNPTCTWQATSLSDWIKILEPSTGSGNGTIRYTVSQNNSVSSRVGTLLISGQNVYVTQNGIQASKMEIVSCDLNGDGFDEIVRLDEDGSIRYSYFMITFNRINGNLFKDINCIDLNGDNKADIVGVRRDGTISYTLDMGNTWQSVSGLTVNLTTSDLNGDKKGDIIAINSSKNIYINTNLRDWSNIPGELEKVLTGDFNTSRSGNEIAGINSRGEIYYSPNLQNWQNVPGNLSLIRSFDVNGDKKSDLIGINKDGFIYYTTDLVTWKNIPGVLIFLVMGDINGDGKGDIIGYNNKNEIFYSTNLQSWTFLPGNYTNLITGDFNGDGKADIAGIDSNNRVYFTTNLRDWILIN